MKSFSLAKALVLVSMLAVMPLACGDDESNPKPSPGDGGEPGAGGTGDGRGGEPALGLAGSEAMGGAPALPPGISLEPKTEECSTTCESASVIGAPGTTFYLDPCCTESDNACGLDTGFLAFAGAMFEETCQARDQPGDLDEACPAADMVAIPVNGQMAMLDAFAGCCRPNGLCGVVVDDVSLGGGIIPVGSLGLGCVDAAPFFPGEDPVTCGAGGGGNAGGSGNAGGEPAVVGGNGAGGASGGAGG